MYVLKDNNTQMAPTAAMLILGYHGKTTSQSSTPPPTTPAKIASLINWVSLPTSISLRPRSEEAKIQHASVMERSVSSSVDSDESVLEQRIQELLEFIYL